MTHTVVGLFNSRDDAQRAMTELIQQGFVQDDIDLSNRRFAGGNNDDNESATGEGTGIGDRISSFFGSLFGGDETTARNYTDAANDADAILTVQVDSEQRARQAQEIFDRNGAIDVDERGYNRDNAARSAGNTVGNANANSSNLQESSRIPVVQETLNVGKQEIERGGARIRSRIIEKPVEENVRLREEHVVVNRRPVDREVTDSDLQNFRPGEMEITERAEVPVVGKQAKVVEEVEVGKNVTERDETVRDTVRATDVDVEQIDTPATKTNKAKRAKP
jgi:uncharacterized protein (TIGR02271 family)